MEVKHKTMGHHEEILVLNIPLVGFDEMPLDVFEVAAEVILQGTDHTAVFIHQLGGSWLSA